MSLLRVYALVHADGPVPPLGNGVAGEPLETVSCEGLAIVVERVAMPGALDTDALRRHDGIVRRIADLYEAVLPARFGQMAADRDVLVERLSPRSAELTAALDRVAGCRQMTLRVFGERQAPAAGPADDDGGAEDRPGTRYLAARARSGELHHRIPDLAPLCRALAPLIREPRPGPASRPPLLATRFDLVQGNRLRAYEAAFEEHRRKLPEASIRVRASGPWPPYGFAPRWS